MKKALAWLLVLAMTAALAVGGTLAYLTDTDEDVNVMTVGKVKIDQLEYEREKVETENEDATVQEFHDNKPLYPAVIEDDFNWTTGDSYVDWEQIGKDGYTSEIWDPSRINNEVDKMVFVKNKGDFDAYVRTVFAFEAGNYETLDEYLADVHFNLNNTDWTWEWQEVPTTIGEGKYFVAVATYNRVLEPGALTEISLSQIALDPSVTNEDVAGFGDTFQVLVQSQAVQADGFEDADTALTEAFGIIDTAVEPPEIPFENDEAIKGMDLRSALHYLNADITGTKITANVSNVVFGLNADHADIVDNYDGTLVDVEQDVPVNAYYVPNGTNYDIYFLANDSIYAPKDSSTLFYQMTALQSVDTDNFDVSRVENMYRMFRDCKALKVLDVSEWNVGNVTNAYDLFRNCRAVTELDVSDWDVSNVTNMNAMFQECVSLTSLDTGAWDTSSVTSMVQMFYKNSNLQTVDVADWDMSSVTSIQSMFAYCTKLSYVDVADWNTSNVTSMVQTFMDCVSLPSVEVGNWKTGKVQRFKAMFATTGQNTGKMLFTELDIENWDTSSAYDLEAMFYGCGKLVSLDLTKWDVSNVTKAPHMFSDCYNLQSVDMSTWNTQSITCLDAMFNDCRALKVIDLSSFSTGKVKEFSQMFEACSSLERVIGLEKWDTSSGQDFSEMFSGCKSLKELDLSAFDTRQADGSYVTYWPSTNWMFLRFLSGCTSLEKITFGFNFSFDGNGNCSAGYKLAMPDASSVEGWDGKWYNVETGEGYLPSEIPEQTAATYVAVKP